MDQSFSFTEFVKTYPTDQSCLEEIVKKRFPKGIICRTCRGIRRHYNVKNRTAFACFVCRTHTSPLAGTLFEKTTTSLRVWFLALFLMTQTKGKISAKQLERELEVTYKTAWRIRTSLYNLMEKNGGDLLIQEDAKVRKWLFFNKIEISVVEKREGSTDK